MGKLIIDRFEGNFVVCEQEDKRFIDIPKYKVPSEAKEGDCLVEIDGIYSIDVEFTAQKKMVIDEKFKKLFRK